MVEEIKNDIEVGNGKPKESLPEEPQQTPKDFKIAEIWIRDGQIQLDASSEFWGDKCRALGILEFCKEIVKTAKAPKEQESKIVIPRGNGPLNFLRNRMRGKK